MHHATVQIVVGTGLIVVACGFVALGVRRLLDARSYSNAPRVPRSLLDPFNIYRKPRWFGSERSTEYLAGTAMLVGGVFAILTGAVILAAGVGGS